jgi:hypothetical protein
VRPCTSDVDFRKIGTGRSVFPTRRLNERGVNLKGESLGGLLFGYFLLATQEKVTPTGGVEKQYFEALI